MLLATRTNDREGACRAPAWPRRRRRRGFTLLEIGIALVLLGLMIAVAVPSLDAVTGARMKEAVNTIGGAIRDTYARTALLGRSTRLVLDMEQQAWWVEESEGVARVKPMKLLADRDGKVALDAKDERIADIDDGTTDLKEQAKVQILTGPAFKPVDGEWGKPQKLPPDVRFKAVWLEHLDDKVGRGVAALYFYPGGHTEEALITLTDAPVGDDDPQAGTVMTLEVAGLTGEVYVTNDEPRVPRLQEDD
jgi:prepilin-type N-terminal cleavage/methylation domain-containing protein